MNGFHGFHGAGDQYGISLPNLLALTNPITAPVAILTGGLKSAQGKCDKYMSAYQSAKAMGKTKKAARLLKRYQKWCAKAEQKAARKSAKYEARAGKYTQDTAMSFDDEGLYDEGLYDEAAMMPAAGGSPSWLLPAIIGGGALLLVVVLASGKR